MDTLEVLNGSGHITVTWNPSKPSEVAEARKEVEQLKVAGYSFFVVTNTKGKDEIEKGNGYIIVKRIEDPTVQDEPKPEQPKLTVVPAVCKGETLKGAPCKRKPKKGTNYCPWHQSQATQTGPTEDQTRPPKRKKASPAQEGRQTGRRTVAVRQMQGGL